MHKVLLDGKFSQSFLYILVANSLYRAKIKHMLLHSDNPSCWSENTRVDTPLNWREKQCILGEI
jgi:hypothetical protein